MSNMDARIDTKTRSAAYFFLEGLVEVGIDYLFCNFGTDHAPIIEELAGRRKRGEPAPKTIRCAHENTAAHMAGGYALVSGHGQGLLVHVDVGTANTANAMHNLFRSRIPVLLMAGKAPFTTSSELTGGRDTYVHFIQEPFDQGSLVRPYVKWEWTLPSGIVVKEALRRAHSIMHSEPQGPVYLMMPRETLAQEWNQAEIRPYAVEQFGQAAQSVADPKHVAKLAEQLLTAQSPILITAYGGRNSNTSQAIEALAEFAGIAVYEASTVNNISHDGPCFMGYNPDHQVSATDVGLLVDVDVPWFPRFTQANPATYWAQIDLDVLKTGSPMWTFPSNLRLQGDSALILAQVLEHLRGIATPKFREAVAARLEKFKAVRAERILQAAKLAAHKGAQNAINPHYLFAELGKLVEPTDLIFDEAISNAGPLALQVPRPTPGTFIRAAGAGLGASGGMALGAKLAAPGRMMVQVVGDGSFYFNNPSSVYAASRQYKLPILSIVLDNSGWGAVKEATLKVFPDGEAKDTGEYEAALCPDVEFGKIAEAFGAYAEKLSDPNDVPAALRRCVDQVRAGRTALLHARVTPI
jgi:acetolactate synthase-1/2/3 large subunit